MLAFEHVLIVGGTSKTIGERSRQESVNEARARLLTNSFHSRATLLLPQRMRAYSQAKQMLVERSG